MCSQNTSCHAYKPTFVACSSCFRACPPNETVSMALTDRDNADGVDPGSLPRRSGSCAHNTQVLYDEVEYGSGVLSLKPVS